MDTGNLIDGQWILQIAHVFTWELYDSQMNLPTRPRNASQRWPPLTFWRGLTFALARALHHHGIKYQSNNQNSANASSMGSGRGKPALQRGVHRRSHDSTPQCMRFYMPSKSLSAPILAATQACTAHAGPANIGCGSLQPQTTSRHASTPNLGSKLLLADIKCFRPHGGLGACADRGEFQRGAIAMASAPRFKLERIETSNAVFTVGVWERVLAEEHGEGTDAVV